MERLNILDKQGNRIFHKLYLEDLAAAGLIVLERSSNNRGAIRWRITNDGIILLNSIDRIMKEVESSCSLQVSAEPFLKRSSPSLLI